MGLLDEIKGRAKKAVGDLTGNKKLARAGEADRVGGHIKDAVNNASEKAKDAVDAVREKADSMKEKADRKD